MLFPIVQKRPIILPSKRRPLGGCSCCPQLLPNSRRRPLRGPSCCSQLSKRDPLFCLHKGGRFAAVNRDILFCLQKGGRFAPVVVVQKRPIILPPKRRPLRNRSCCYLLIQKGARPLRGCSCCSLPNSRRRPLRGPSCCSRLSKRDPLLFLRP